MNPFSSAFKEKAKLTKFGRKLLRSRNFTESVSPQEWIDAIKTIRTYRKHRRLAAGLTTVLLILCLLAIAFTLFVGEPLYSLIALIGIIFCINLFCYLRKGKFAKAATVLLCPIIATLREDMKPTAPLEISLDLSGSTAPRKKTSSRAVPDSELYIGMITRTNHFYEDPWLIIRGKLVDQTAFQIIIQNEIRESKTVKKSVSGKTKHKTKYKHKTKKLVTLKPPATAKPVYPPPLKAACSTIIKEKDEGFTIVATDQISGAGKTFPMNVKADDIIEMFASASARYK